MFVKSLLMSWHHLDWNHRVIVNDNIMVLMVMSMVSYLFGIFKKRIESDDTDPITKIQNTGRFWHAAPGMPNVRSDVCSRFLHTVFLKELS